MSVKAVQWPNAVDDVDALLASLLKFPEMRGVDLGRNRVHDRHVALLLATCPDLEGLSLSSTSVSDESTSVIASLENLRWLNLNFTNVGDDGLRVLNECESLMRGGLSLHGTRVGEQAIRRCREAFPDLSVHWARTSTEHAVACRLLERDGWVITVQEGPEQTVRYNVSSPYAMTTLRSAASDPQLSEESLTSFRNVEHLHRLAIGGLSLSNPDRNPIGDAEMHSIGPLPRLRELDLSRTLVSDHCRAVFAGMTELRVLRLGRTQVSDGTVAELLHLDGLEILDLRDCRNLTDESIVHLQSLDSLRRLDLGGTGVTAPAIERLREVLTETEVVW